MTDMDLSRLLTQVNAREVTKKLFLYGCSAIRGTGLLPLRHSHVLQTINLRKTGVDENPTPFLWNLRPMISHNLVKVLLSDECKAQESVLEFMRSLREMRVEQAREQGTQCECCNQPVVEEARQLVPNMHGFPRMQCFWCYKYFCRKGSCSMSMRECHKCGEALCDECEMAFPCDFGCGRSFCFRAACCEISYCCKCGKKSCKDCEGVITCDYCKDNTVCSDCGTFPDICNSDCVLCADCHNLGTCAQCGDSFCVLCKDDETKQCYHEHEMKDLQKSQDGLVNCYVGGLGRSAVLVGFVIISRSRCQRCIRQVSS
jgi:hypothetical protein